MSHRIHRKPQEAAANQTGGTSNAYQTRLRAAARLAGRARPDASASPPAAAAATSSSSTEASEGRQRPRSSIQRTPDNGKVSLTIGSKNFPEQEILGEIYAQALEAAGYKVKTDLNLGSETVALKAVKTGEISGYPEYA